MGLLLHMVQDEVQHVAQGVSRRRVVAGATRGAALVGGGWEAHCAHHAAPEGVRGCESADGVGCWQPEANHQRRLLC